MNFPTSASFPASAHFPGTATFPATATFPSTPDVLELTNLQKLSLPANTPVGTRVQVTDGFVVSGLTDDAVNGNGFFAPVGVYNGKTSYVNTRIAGSTVANTGVSIFWNGSLWSIDDESGLGGICTSIEDVAEPWLVTSWSIAGGVTTSAPTLTHPAVQQLAAPSTEQGGVFVAGGTQDGIYVKGDPEFAGNSSRQMFVLLGHENQYSNWSLYWDDINSEWYFYDSDGGQLYYSESDVATPDLATNWKNASDDSPASIAVTSVPQGELDAGLSLGPGFETPNSSAIAIGSNDGRLSYLAGQFDDTLTWINEAGIWSQAGDPAGIGNTAFPWQANWAPATVTRNNVASESNWQVVP